MRNASAIERLSQIAGKQLGLFTRAEANEVGLTNQQIRRLLEQGVVQRLTPKVFRFAATATSWFQTVLAACLDGGPECVASHRTAAALHRFDGFTADVIEVLVPMHVRHRRRNVIVHHTRSLVLRDCTRVGLIPVTTTARTLIDLGAVAPADSVEQAFDGAQRDGDVRRRDVEGGYADLRARGRNGIGAMTLILENGRGGATPRSVLERQTLRVLSAAGLPAPAVGHRVMLADGTRYELDFAYPIAKLAIEVDGHGSHATRRDRATDNLRANALGGEGWRIRRFTYEQVVYDPSVVVRTVRAALSAAV
jgi:hypothetical protein